MSNVKFVYLYRDGANYKSWGEVVFGNPERFNSDEIENRLVAAFLPDKLFVASQVFLPEKFLFLNGKFTKHDHCYHEFDSIEFCEENTTDKRSISDFLKDIELVSKQGWEAFDILDRT